MQDNQYDLETMFGLCESDFDIFVQFILGFKNEQFHNELDQTIGNELNKKIVITYPRGHGKSTHLSVAYPLWRIAKNHNLRILLISSTEPVSKSFLSEIMGHIENNLLYKAFAKWCDPLQIGVEPKMKNYAKLRESWSGNQIVIARNQLNLKDPTINAVGLLGSILSKRADLIICDDIVNQENSATEDQRLKVIDWIDTTVRPVLVPEGRFMYLGNTWHMDDYVARALKNPQFDYRKRMKAIISESTHPELWDQWARTRTNEELTIEERLIQAEVFYREHQIEMDDGVEVLWPSRYSYGWLILERMSNPYAFARMYQCDPSDRPDQRFKDAWLDMACKKGAKLRLQKSPRTDLIMELTTEGLDLAISEKASSDDTALLILDVVKYSNIEGIKTGDIIIRDIERGKFSPNTVREMVKSDYDIIKPDGIRVETVAYQEAMQKDLDEMGVPVRGYKTGSETRDPGLGINGMAIYAEIGKLILPYDQSDPRTIRLIAQLMNEMRAFPDGHIGDSLMALWFAFSEMRDLRGDRVVVPNAQDPRLVDPPDLRDPIILAAEEKKADMAQVQEQEYERSMFNEMMRGLRG